MGPAVCYYNAIRSVFLLCASQRAAVQCVIGTVPAVGHFVVKDLVVTICLTLWYRSHALAPRMPWVRETVGTEVEETHLGSGKIGSQFAKIALNCLSGGGAVSDGAGDLLDFWHQERYVVFFCDALTTLEDIVCALVKLRGLDEEFVEVDPLWGKGRVRQLTPCDLVQSMKAAATKPLNICFKLFACA